MRSFLFAALAAGTMIAGASVPAAAGPTYAYCTDSMVEGLRCSYSTLEQCRAAASGIGIGCIVNPVIAAAPVSTEAAHENRRKPRVQR